MCYKVGIRVIVVPAAKNVTSKIYLKDILHHKATFTELVYLVSNVAYKTRRRLEILNCKKGGPNRRFIHESSRILTNEMVAKHLFSMIAH